MRILLILAVLKFILLCSLSTGTIASEVVQTANWFGPNGALASGRATFSAHGPDCRTDVVNAKFENLEERKDAAGRSMYDVLLLFDGMWWCNSLTNQFLRMHLASDNHPEDKNLLRLFLERNQTKSPEQQVIVGEYPPGTHFCSKGVKTVKVQISREPFIIGISVFERRARIFLSQGQYHCVIGGPRGAAIPVPTLPTSTTVLTTASPPSAPLASSSTAGSREPATKTPTSTTISTSLPESTAKDTSIASKKQYGVIFKMPSLPTPPVRASPSPS